MPKRRPNNNSATTINGTLGYRPRVEASELGTLVFYRLTEYELETFRSGGNASYQSEIASFLAGTIVALVIALFTTDMSDVIKSIFWTAAGIFTIIFIILLIIICKEKGKVERLYKEIVSRTRTKIG